MKIILIGLILLFTGCESTTIKPSIKNIQNKEIDINIDIRGELYAEDL